MNGRTYEVVRFAAQIRQERGVAIVSDPSSMLSEFAEVVATDLASAGFEVLVVTQAVDVPAIDLAALGDVLADHGSPLLLVAFGAAGPGAWSALERLGDAATWAFLVSCELPQGGIDFENLMSTGVRAIYALDGPVYRNSYWETHLPMQELETPHDFLVYDGFDDDFYDSSSDDFQPEAWDEARASMLDWLQVWSPEMRHP